jgi:hypothetical protein
MSLLTNSEFCVLRDQFQRERQAAALPVLKAREMALQAEIAVLVARRGARVSIALEEEIGELQFEKQWIDGQISMIEKGKS